MDVESLLRDALDVRRVDGEPSIGFDQRVIGSLRERRSRPARFVPAFVGLAAVLALTAVVLPWYLGAANHPGSVASASSSPSPLPSETPASFIATAVPKAIPMTHV